MRKVPLVVALFSLAACAGPAGAPGMDATGPCNPAFHGGVAGDGRSDTEAVQAAIDACAGTGGRTVIPEGVWDIGLIRLGSDMEFHLDEGAVLRLIPDIEQFPEVDATSDEADPKTVRTAIYGRDVSDLTISGTGRIEGNGPAFWDPDFYTSGLKRPTLPRPAPVIELSGCSGVTVKEIEMVDLPGFAIRFNTCEDVRAEGVRIANDPRSPNTDGIQLRDTSNALITGVDIRTGDDAVVLKTGERRMTNIIVEDSYLESDDGALKFGTGSYVGVEDSVFRDLTIGNSRYGIAIFMIDGGRHANNRFERITIETGGRHDRTYPIFMDIDRREADRTLGEIEGFVFEDITIRTTGASLIAGNPEAPIRNLTLRDVEIEALPGAEAVTETSGKPRGNKNIIDQSGSVDYAGRDAHLVFGHIDGLVLDGVTIRATEARLSRTGVALIDVALSAEPEGAYSAAGRARSDFIEEVGP